MFKDTHLCLLTRACSFTSCRQCGEKPLSIDCSQSWLSTSRSNEGGIKGKYHSSSLVSEVLPPAVIIQVHWYAQLTIQTSGFLATKAISLSIYLILSIACFVLVSTTGLTCHSPPSMPSAWGCSGVLTTRTSRIIDIAASCALVTVFVSRTMETSAASSCAQSSAPSLAHNAWSHKLSQQSLK